MTQHDERAGSTMKAIVQDRYGRPDVLELRQVPVPEPAADQVLIRVRASSLNMYDWHMTTGTPYLARAQAGLRVPKRQIPGADFAGVVEAVGADAAGFTPGDEVFGCAAGAWAELMCAREQRIAAKPAEVTFEQAAAIPMAGVTALQGLRDVGGLRSGQRVLVNGASGGVGTFAVQIAKALGATVTAVCSTTKVDMVRSIGADRVIDYTREDFTETERGHDLLFDNVGDRPWSETKRVLTETGVNVGVTGRKHRWLGPFRELVYRKAAAAFDSRRFAWFTASIRSEDLEFLAGLVASGAVVPVVEDTYPLEKAPEALWYLGDGHAAGKLVITV
jgi:NADPH:quinone reductase-like Zn-dependent oxidoreductase